MYSRGRYSERIPSLDGFRGVAIGLVLLDHFQHGFSRQFPHLVSERAGHFGVLIFFVLSGYLVTRLLQSDAQRSGAVNLRHFYLRRAFRILPASLFYLAFAAVCLTVSGQAAPGALAALLARVFFVGNYFSWGEVPGVERYLGHFWSLGVEEQFYLVWPFLFVKAGRWRARIPFLLTLCALFARLFWAARGNFGASLHHTEAVVDGLAVGCLIGLADLREWNGAAWLRNLLPILLLALAFLLGCPSVHLGVFSAGGGTAATILVAATLVLVVQHPGSPLGRLLNWRPLEALGKVSFSLYLWNEPFVWGGLGGWPGGPLVGILCGIASYHWIEQPIRAAGRRWLERRPETAYRAAA